MYLLTKYRLINLKDSKFFYYENQAMKLFDGEKEAITIYSESTTNDEKAFRFLVWMATALEAKGEKVIWDVDFKLD